MGPLKKSPSSLAKTIKMVDKKCIWPNHKILNICLFFFPAATLIISFQKMGSKTPQSDIAKMDCSGQITIFHQPIDFSEIAGDFHY